jgi:hypothetical protein
MTTVVIKIHYGGLGDHLFYSPIPRILKDYCGIDHVYLSVDSQIRSFQTFELVWKCNPYLDGLSSDLPTKTIPERTKINKIINIVLSRYSATDYEAELFPEIYSNVRVDKRYKGKKFIDLNYISFCGAFTSFDALAILWKRPEFILVNPSFLLRLFSRNPIVNTDSLADYANLIFSSRCFCAVTSGGASLASALKKRCVVYYGYGHMKVYRHGNNKNIMVGGSGTLRRVISWIYIKKNSINAKFKILFSRECSLKYVFERSKT